MLTFIFIETLNYIKIRVYSTRLAPKNQRNELLLQDVFSQSGGKARPCKEYDLAQMKRIKRSMGTSYCNPAECTPVCSHPFVLPLI